MSWKPVVAPRMLTGLIAAAVLSMGQSGTGGIEGRVFDPAGAVITGAEVRARNVANGLEQKATSNNQGLFRFVSLAAGKYAVTVESPGFHREVRDVEVSTGRVTRVDVQLQIGSISESVTVRSSIAEMTMLSSTLALGSGSGRGSTAAEEYGLSQEDGFSPSRRRPLSTFSIDVDTASYSNVRRFLKSGMLPPTKSVRIEEMLNSFEYQYPNPSGKHPFSVVTALVECPWNKEHRIAQVALKTKSIEMEDVPALNLTFLIDVSGSMDVENKLPLVKRSLGLLVEKLRRQDRVAIVVYAGAAGLVLDSTRGSEKARVLAAVDGLRAGGSTAGGAGIQLAYAKARENFIEGGNNRVILTTDGDFNVGVSQESELKDLIEKERDSGVYLTVLGYGMGNLKDNRMELLAQHGNGNYAYIDDLLEAKRVLVEQMGATLVTIAKDVKVQVEFNPAKVKSYRLIGYDNRRLKEEDFRNDKKDAGELGAGHVVTALYEIEPVGGNLPESEEVPPLRYQTKARSGAVESELNEVFIVRLRYKKPGAERGTELMVPVENRLTKPDAELRFALAVSEFGLILRQSKYKGKASLDRAARNAAESLGEDPGGRRAEFVYLVRTAKGLGGLE